MSIFQSPNDLSKLAGIEFRLSQIAGKMSAIRDNMTSLFPPDSHVHSAAQMNERANALSGEAHVTPAASQSAEHKVLDLGSEGFLGMLAALRLALVSSKMCF